MYKTVTKSNPLKLDAAEQKMATTVYFSGGMTLDQTKLAAAQFKSDYTELGSRRSQDELAVNKARAPLIHSASLSGGTCERS